MKNNEADTRVKGYGADSHVYSTEEAAIEAASALISGLPGKGWVAGAVRFNNKEDAPWSSQIVNGTIFLYRLPVPNGRFSWFSTVDGLHSSMCGFGVTPEDALIALRAKAAELMADAGVVAKLFAEAAQ